jgi:hypothetical protein
MRRQPPEDRVQNLAQFQYNLFSMNNLQDSLPEGHDPGWNGIVRGVVFLANQPQSSCTIILEFIGLCDDSGFLYY